MRDTVTVYGYPHDPISKRIQRVLTESFSDGQVLVIREDTDDTALLEKSGYDRFPIIEFRNSYYGNIGQKSFKAIVNDIQCKLNIT